MIKNRTDITLKCNFAHLVPLKKSGPNYEYWEVSELYFDKVYNCDITAVWAEIGIYNNKNGSITKKLNDHINAVDQAGNPVDWIKVFEELVTLTPQEIRKDARIAVAKFDANELKLRTKFENDKIKIEALSLSCKDDPKSYQNICIWNTLKVKTPHEKIVKSGHVGTFIDGDDVRWFDS